MSVETDTDHNMKRYRSGDHIRCATIRSYETGLHFMRENVCSDGEWIDSGECTSESYETFKVIIPLCPATILLLGWARSYHIRKQLAALAQVPEPIEMGSIRRSACHTMASQANAAIVGRSNVNAVSGTRWAPGERVDVETAEGIEHDAVVLGPGDTCGEVRVRFTDGQIDSWPVEDIYTSLPVLQPAVDDVDDEILIAERGIADAETSMPLEVQSGPVESSHVNPVHNMQQQSL